jgi:hypothetical protein
MPLKYEGALVNYSKELKLDALPNVADGQNSCMKMALTLQKGSVVKLESIINFLLAKVLSRAETYRELVTV